MSSIDTADPVNGNLSSVESPSIVWGAAEIGRIINRSKRQTHHLLSRGYIKSAKQIGGRWCASTSALLKEFGG